MARAGSTEIAQKIAHDSPHKSPRRLGGDACSQRTSFPLSAGFIASLLEKVCSSVHVQNAIKKTKVMKI